MDAYLFLYFSEFLTLRELVLYTRTSKYYRESLIMDSIENRFRRETRVNVSSYISADAAVKMSSYTQTKGLHTMTFSAKDQTIEYDIHSKDICIDVPGWRFSWYGNIIISYGIDELMQREYAEVRVAQTQFAEIDVILSYDRLNQTIIINEIIISYEKKMRRWLWRHRVRRYLMSVFLMCVIIVGTYHNPGICVITSLIGLALVIYHTRKIHPSYFDIYPSEN